MWNTGDTFFGITDAGPQGSLSDSVPNDVQSSVAKSGPEFKCTYCVHGCILSAYHPVSSIISWTIGFQIQISSILDALWLVCCQLNHGISQLQGASIDICPGIIDPGPSTPALDYLGLPIWNSECDVTPDNEEMLRAELRPDQDIFIGCRIFSQAA